MGTIWDIFAVAGLASALCESANNGTAGELVSMRGRHENGWIHSIFFHLLVHCLFISGQGMFLLRKDERLDDLYCVHK